uniref:Uncharacterized protein n=1 Tax=Sphaerodactylus townsendi TaxID=933632 RepID=A0ACB8ERU9_9SAUR
MGWRVLPPAMPKKRIGETARVDLFPGYAAHRCLALWPPGQLFIPRFSFQAAGTKKIHYGAPAEAAGQCQIETGRAIPHRCHEGSERGPLCRGAAEMYRYSWPLVGRGRWEPRLWKLCLAPNRGHTRRKGKPLKGKRTAKFSPPTNQRSGLPSAPQAFLLFQPYWHTLSTDR